MTEVLTEIDHVAIAVRDLDAAVAWYEEMFGATVAHREKVEREFNIQTESRWLATILTSALAGKSEGLRP